MDIEEKFLELLRQRAERESLTIETIQGEFLNLPAGGDVYDAALFFECFHHCIRFRELLDRLRAALKPGGKIVFCGESFYGEWFDFPWGVRLDGHSVWAIRNFGWMELGFRESYITAVLEKAGFDVQKTESSVGPIGVIFVATARPK
jgi:SAM-dependent methyltransferase